MMVSELTIVIVNYRTPEFVIACLESLADERDSCTFEVIIVDNKSGDDSVEKIRSSISLNGRDRWIRLIESETNLGFAGGNNLALRQEIKSPFVLLLNSDTVVLQNCLAKCLSVIRQDSSIGILSCKLLNTDGTIQNTARKFPSPSRQILSALGLSYRFPKLFGWANIQDPVCYRDSVCR